MSEQSDCRWQMSDSRLEIDPCANRSQTSNRYSPMANRTLFASSRLCGLLCVVHLVSPILLRAQEPLCELGDAGGHRLYYCVYGGGEPTVVMDVGASDNSSAWMLEQAREAMPEPIRDEFDAAEESRAQLRASGPLPTVPLIVLSAGRNTYLPTSRSAEIAELWLELQGQLAQLIPNGRHIVASGLGHYVHRDDRLLVLGLIRQVVVAARGG